MSNNKSTKNTKFAFISIFTASIAVLLIVVSTTLHSGNLHHYLFIIAFIFLGLSTVALIVDLWKLKTQ